MKFPAGTRVLVDLYDQDRPATVIRVIDYTDRGGKLHERRLVFLDEPAFDGDVERRWNVELETLSEHPNTD
jgi:hypothetical protein